MSGQKSAQRSTIPWWLWILGIDVFVVTVSAINHYPLSFPGKDRLVRHFNLAVEMNAGVWWSAISLLVLALLAYELFSREDAPGKFAWLALSVVFACLSLDELGSLHERVGGWSKLLPYGVVFVSLVAYAVTVLFRNRQTRHTALFISAGICVFGSVALQEYLEHNLPWPTWSLGLRVAVEEGSELLGILLLFFGIVPQRAQVMTPSLRAIIPDPPRMNNLHEILLTGGLLHILAAMILPTLIDVTEKGNPLVWYPASVFFVLFAATRGYAKDPETRPGLRLLLSVFFFLCSAGFAYDPPRLLPFIGSMFQREHLPGIFFFSLAALLLLIGAFIPGFWRGNRRYLPPLFLLPLITLVDTRLEIRHVVAGVMTLLVFNIYRRYDPGALTGGKAEVTLLKKISAVAPNAIQGPGIDPPP